MLPIGMQVDLRAVNTFIVRKQARLRKQENSFCADRRATATNRRLNGASSFVSKSCGRFMPLLTFWLLRTFIGSQRRELLAATR